jgi:general secretion pathway protein L
MGIKMVHGEVGRVMGLRERWQSIFSLWMDAVTASIASIVDRFARPPTIRIVQNSSREFQLYDATGVSTLRSFDLTVSPIPGHVAAAVAGSHVELLLEPDPFLFRPMELPNRATEFLQGIIRAQIDRLTPWSADNAAFGASEPVASGSERVVVTVAATAKSALAPFENAITRLGAHSLSVLARQLDRASSKPIVVLDKRISVAGKNGGTRRTLTTILYASCIVAGVAFASAALVDVSLNFQQADVTRQLNALRAAAGSAQQTVERRKIQSPAAVMLLEALSEILPDHTYVTELRIENSKVRISGVSRDAASLIGLIEKTGRFTSANFFAPTVRSPGETSERFHIEAIIHSATASRS